MDPFIVAVILIIAGAAFLIYEAFSPGAFMVIPGTVLVIVGLIGAAFPDKLYTWWSPLAALIVAVPVSLVTVKAYQRLAEPEPPTTTVADSLTGREGTVTVPNPKAQLPVGTLQAFLDDYLVKNPGARVDYIHGEDVARELAGSREDAVACLLPPMGKERLFPTVIHDGVLPRKTFSMGEAQDKRFYLEARKIRV